MASTLFKKSAKRVAKSLKSKTIVPASEPVGRILEMKPARAGMHHGLTLGTVILILVIVGAVATSILEYQKMSAAIVYADDAATKLAQATEENVDLAERVKNLETVGALAAKAPAREVYLKTYSSPNLSLDYPAECALVKATNDLPALTINCSESKVEVFRTKDFPGGTRTLPDGVIASKIGSLDNPKVVPYDVWIFANNDEAVLNKIVASIKIIK